IWSWHPIPEKPLLTGIDSATVKIKHPELPAMRWYCEGTPGLLFCENDTNPGRLFGTAAEGYFKDGINDYIVAGKHDAVNPEPEGTKVAAHYRLSLPAGGSAQLRVRL